MSMELLLRSRGSLTPMCMASWSPGLADGFYHLLRLCRCSPWSQIWPVGAHPNWPLSPSDMSPSLRARPRFLDRDSQVHLVHLLPQPWNQSAVSPLSSASFFFFFFFLWTIVLTNHNLGTRCVHCYLGVPYSQNSRIHTHTHTQKFHYIIDNHKFTPRD